MQYEFFTIDVFTSEMFSGAQIAVFPHAEGLSDEQMQLLAGEMNLTESVFILPAEDPSHTRRMRIFSPQEEIDFAGHPIIACAYVLAKLGEIDLSETHNHLILEQNCGPIDSYVTLQDGQPSMVQFTMTTTGKVDHYLPSDEELAAILGLEAGEIESRPYSSLVVNSTSPVLVVPVKNYQSLRKACFNYNRWSSSSAPSTLAREVLIFSQESEVPGTDFHARRLGPAIGINEDPPIGTLMPAFTSYLCAHEQVKEGTHTFSIARGSKQSRLSLLNIEMDNRATGEVKLRVGGPAVLVARGQIEIPD